MQWAAIFAVIWEVLGPILTDLLKKLFDNLFDKLDPPNPEAPAAEIERAFSIAEKRLGRFAPVRKAMLRMAKRSSVARASAIFEAAKAIHAVPALSADERGMMDDVMAEVGNDGMGSGDQPPA